MSLFKPKLRQDIQEKLKELNPLVFVSVPVVSGLSVAEGTLCQIYYCKDQICFGASGFNFILSLDKVQDISIKTDIDIQHQVVSSVGGAIAGAALLGVPGAIIGGRAKAKTTRDIKIYLVISFESDGCRYISFDVTHTPNSRKIVEAFGKSHKQSQTIEL